MRTGKLTRIRYWLDQIGAHNDFEGTKPIVIVGTHADLLKKPAKANLIKEMEELYPTPPSHKQNRSQKHIRTPDN